MASMKKGELAQLTLAPAYAYGPAGSPPSIPPEATLVFEVELLYWKSVKDITGEGGWGGLLTGHSVTKLLTDQAGSRHLAGGFQLYGSVLATSNPPAVPHTYVLTNVSSSVMAVAALIIHTSCSYCQHTLSALPPSPASPSCR